MGEASRFLGSLANFQRVSWDAEMFLAPIVDRTFVVGRHKVR